MTVLTCSFLQPTFALLIPSLFILDKPRLIVDKGMLGKVTEYSSHGCSRAKRIAVHWRISQTNLHRMLDRGMLVLKRAVSVERWPSSSPMSGQAVQVFKRELSWSISLAEEAQGSCS